MAIIKETKYLTFDAYNIPQRKTKIVQVINKSSENELATIEWYGPWRQYCLFPSLEFDTVWNHICLTDILAVIDMLMKERVIDKPKGE